MDREYTGCCSLDGVKVDMYRWVSGLVGGLVDRVTVGGLIMVSYWVSVSD